MKVGKRERGKRKKGYLRVFMYSRSELMRCYHNIQANQSLKISYLSRAVFLMYSIEL